MPVSCWFEGEEGWGAHVYEEVPVPADGDRKQKVAVMTQQMATAFEHGIREHLTDWHMLQRVFVADLDPERLARSRARNGNSNGNGNGGPPSAAPPPAAAPAPPPSAPLSSPQSAGPGDNSKKQADP